MNLEFLLASAHARIDAARAIPADALLLIAATCVILLFVSYVGWVKASNRLRDLAHRNIALAGEIATARRALDTERKWRLVAEKTVADTTKTALTLEPLPPHALQALLERENANPIQPGTAAAEPEEEFAAPLELEEPPAPAPAALHTASSPAAETKPETAAPARIEEIAAPAAPAPVEKKPAPAAEKKPAPASKSSRRTAKVAGLINRTIFE
jgi:hypothetical protein